MSKMKRNFLEDLGLEKEVVDKIMAENGKDIENAKANYDELKAELKTANATIADRDNQLKELKIIKQKLKVLKLIMPLIKLLLLSKLKHLKLLKQCLIWKILSLTKTATLQVLMSR